MTVSFVQPLAGPKGLASGLPSDLLGSPPPFFSIALCSFSILKILSRCTQLVSLGVSLGVCQMLSTQARCGCDYQAAMQVFVCGLHHSVYYV